MTVVTSRKAESSPGRFRGARGRRPRRSPGGAAAPGALGAPWAILGPRVVPYAPRVSSLWVRGDHLGALSPKDREKFLPPCPDFVVELCSRSDPLTSTEARQREHVDNGARLGLLIDSAARRVQVYREGGGVDVLANPVSVLGDAVLPSFVLALAPSLSFHW